MTLDTAADTLNEMRLSRIEGFPAELLSASPLDLWRHLSGPTLFHIPGRRADPLFVTVLLHGNEWTSWEAIQTVLRAHRGTDLPRSLLLFAGNIAAARANVRTLPGQTDYNRTWPGTPHTLTAEARVMAEVTEIVRRAKPMASIDIHNNTGHNPHYACVNRLDERYFHLARLFSRTVVYFTKPEGVQSAALADICPAVTVECGRVGGAAGTAHAADFINAALTLSHIPDHAVPDHDLDLMQTFAIAKVPPHTSFSFDGAEADLRFRPDLDQLNFSELGAGTSFGTLGGAGEGRLHILPGSEGGAAGEYFDYSGGEIRLAREAIPAMLTLDHDAVRLDCLGYLMHRIDRSGRMLNR